jgi:hypothetical protein
MALDLARSRQLVSSYRRETLTLNLGDGLLKQALPESRLGKLGINGLLDALDEVELLSLTLALLEADPRVKDGLELGLDGGILSDLEVLVLESVDLLGDGVELLGKGHDLLELVDRVDTVGHSLSVVVTGGRKDTLDAVNVVVGPSRVWCTDRTSDGEQDDEETGSKNSLLVGNVELSRDGGGGETSTENDTTSLGEEGRSGDGVDNGGGLVVWALLCDIISLLPFCLSLFVTHGKRSHGS